MCIKQIRKRDNSVVSFNPDKITIAISKAGKSTGEFDKYIAYRMCQNAVFECEKRYNESIPTVEQVQDIVERVLMSSPYQASAKAYILYRDRRTQMRNLNKHQGLELVDGYLNKLDWRLRENSNQGFSLQGLNNYISSDITTEYWLSKIYTPEIRRAHVEGDMHIHDLNLLSVYCVGWDLMDLLRQGFKGVSGNIESAPARHFRTALGQLINFFYTLQGEAAGAQAVSNFDTFLSPFIRFDNLDYNQVKQALQEFVFNINVPTRVGFQTPFTNVTLDLECPSMYKDTPVIYGGKDIDMTYSMFQREMDMFNKAFAEVMMAGDFKGRVFTFPIPTYNITKDFDWDNPNYAPIWKMTGKYGIPYFSNFVNSDMSPDDARSMCCRLRLDNRELRKRGGGLFGANPLTGSIGVVTVNLPRIGYYSSTEKEFYNRLDTIMQLARESLIIKRKELERFTAGGLYPYTEYYLRDIKARTGKFWSNHFSTIGLVGMNEAALNFLGKDITTEAGRAFALRVLRHMRSRLEEFQAETGDIFNLEATPAEGTSFRLARLDQRYCEGIMSAGGEVGAKVPYYTNSTQLPVGYTDDIFDVLDLQDELQTVYTGGTVLHGFLGESVVDVNTVKNLVRTITSNYRLPYFTITPTFSVCPEHGYLHGEQAMCPECGAETEVYSRVVGYLRPVSRWNDGKQKEYRQRKVYAIPGESQTDDFTSKTLEMQQAV